MELNSDDHKYIDKFFEDTSNLIIQNKFQEAITILNKVIFETEDYTSLKYQEILYLLGVAFSKMYELEKKNEYAYHAIIAFTSANNIHLARNNAECKKCISAIIFVKQIFTIYNTKSVS